MKKKLKSMGIMLLTATYLCGCGQVTLVRKTVIAETVVSNKLEVSKIYSGFKLKSKKYVEAIDSTMYEFEHVKTGAKTFYIENDDQHKAFSVGFKTPVKNNTGVNHIIEHIIASSLKGTQGTGGNDETAGDYTNYYGCTEYEKQLSKIIDDNLHAVFYPTTLKDEKYFEREGWRYEMDSKGQLKLNGVVYNEMRGNYSRDFSPVLNEIDKSLGNLDQGGNPDNIPDLTYNQLVETYNKYYTPSNSCMYLYGKMDIQKILAQINDEYLSKFKKVKVDDVEKTQKFSSKMKYVEAYYPVPKDADIKNKTIMALSYVLKGNPNVLNSQIANMLVSQLLEKIRKEMTSKGVMGSVLYTIYVSKGHPQLSIILQDGDERQKDAFKKIVDNTLRDVMKNGISKDLMGSLFNQNDISARENNSKGIRGQDYMGNILYSWSHNLDPIESFDNEKIKAKVTDMLKKEKLKEFIKTNLLENPQSSFVVDKPKPGLEEENAEKLNKKLSDYKATLSKEQLNQLEKKMEDFQKWTEELAKTQNNSQATLSLSDVDKKAQEIPTNIKEVNGARVLQHNLFTDGVGYINMYFDTTKVPQDKLNYLMLLSKVLGRIETDKYDCQKLQNNIGSYTGGIGFYLDAFLNNKNQKDYYAKMQVSLSTLDNNLKNSMDIIDEIINKSKFTDKSSLRKLIEDIKGEYKNNIQTDTFQFLYQQCEGYSSDYGAYSNLSGIPFYNFISELDNNFDSKADEIIKNLEEVRKEAFDKDNLICSYTGDKTGYKNFEKSFTDLLSKIKTNNLKTQKYSFTSSVKKEGFIIPSEVQYVGKAGNFADLGYKSSGKMQVLKDVIDQYLGKEIRTVGGAYGYGNSMGKQLDVFYSYRDPNLESTIDIFCKTGEYLKNYSENQNEVNKHIARALFVEDFPGDPASKGIAADEMYITGQTQADKQKYRDEILSTTPEDIRNYADMVDKMMKQDNLCVIGGEKKIQEQKALFDKIKKLLDK